MAIDRSCRAILAVLLHHAGEEVSKQRLLEAGWPNRIVHENSLAKAIGRLRQVLGAQGEALETAYGHGYKLNAQVRAPEVPAPAAAPVAETGEGAGGRRSTVLFAGGALLALAGVGGAIALGGTTSEGTVPFRTTPPVVADAPDAIGRLLWVDDNPQNNIYEARFFENHRIAVHKVTGTPDAMRLLAMYDYDVVISDMGRGEDRLAGLRLAGEMRAKGDATPLIIYTVRPEGDEAQQAQRELVAEAGAQGVVVTPQEVRAAVLRLFDNPAPRPGE